MSAPESPPGVADSPSTEPLAPTGKMTAAQVLAFARLLEPQYLLMIISAVGIIWLGAHGALRRPPSAAPPKLKKGQKRQREDKFVEGLVASDVIRFPLLLAAVLVGLYYLIQWLQDPTMLNKILRGYMSTMSIAGVATLTGDALNILTSSVFPAMWADGSGRVYHIDPRRRCQYVAKKETGKETVVKEKVTPLPGRLSHWVPSKAGAAFLWELRNLVTEEWAVKIVVYGKLLVKADIRATDLARFAFAGAVAVAYHFSSWDAISNFLSMAMCYSSFRMFSPTSFTIGSMVLVSLFVYDVVMVFYTPYMITVAKTIDAPIKLVFTSATGASMLGLGDIVVPGMMMALALRFDSYQHYQRKVKLEPIELATTTAATTTAATTTAATPTDTSDTSSDETQEATTTTTTTSHRRIKATYTDTLGQWGNRLWTSPRGRLPADDAEAADAISATAFPKPYFHASVAGYTAGMVVTLVVMLVSGHGQPALLYLVPGVTGSLWLTGLVRREVGDMWVYTEDGSLDTEEVVVEVDGEGKVVEENEVEEEEEEEEGEEESGSEEKRDQKKKKTVEEEKKKLLGEEKGKELGDKLNLFMLSVTAPRAAAAIS